MAFAKIDVTKGITGTIPVANGGTGLASGTSGQFLKFTGSTTLASSALGDVGKVLQVIDYQAASYVNTNSNSYVNFSSMAVTITPSATSSKILLTHSAPSMLYVDNTSNMAHVSLFRDSTNITTAGHNNSYASYDQTNYQEGSSFTYLDSPNTTSAITYRIKCKVDNTSMSFVYGTHYSNGSQPRMSGLTAMEIGA